MKTTRESLDGAFLFIYNMAMHYSQIPEKPLIASMTEKTFQPQRVYFFERSDGSIIDVEENEAWSLYSRRPQMLSKGGKRPEFRLIGTGDGLIFYEALEKAKIAGRTDIEEAKKILREGKQAELEACRGKIVPPPNRDKFEM